MRFYAGLDPAFAGLNAGAQCLDIAGARLARLLRRGGFKCASGENEIPKNL